MTQLNQSVKKHSCPTCGGQLTVDIASQMYVCPFCGVNFDYEYFREDDVLARASRALRAKEYKSAGEAYDFMLTKDPHNFEALRGKILVSAGIPTIQALRQTETLRGMNYKVVQDNVLHAVEVSQPEHTGYFSKMQELLKAGKAYQSEVGKTSLSRNERKEQYARIRRYEHKIDEEYLNFPDRWDHDEVTSVHPKTTIIGALAIYGVWVLLMVILLGTVGGKSYSSDTSRKASISIVTSIVQPGAKTSDQSSKSKENNTISRYLKDYDRLIAQPSREAKEKEEKETTRLLWGLIILPGLAVAAFVAYSAWKWNNIKQFEEKIRQEEKIAGEITSQVNQHESEANRLRAQINKLYSEMMKLDPMPEAMLPLPKSKENK